MESKNLAIICIIIIIAVSIGAFFVAFQKNSEITVISPNILNSGDDFKIILTANSIGIPNQEVYLKLTDEMGEETYINSKTNSEGMANFTLYRFESGNYQVECVFSGNVQYKGTSLNSTLSISDLARESSSTSADNGWPFDAPEGWHWERTPPGETWLIKDDGNVERLYVGTELYLENTRVNGEMEKSYDNGKDAAGVQVSAPTRYF